MNPIMHGNHTRSFAACLACLAITACGGDGGPTPAASTTSATTAAVGAGGVSGQTPIVARPTPGPCAATGTDAIPSPLLNSQLDCAP